MKARMKHWCVRLSIPALLLAPEMMGGCASTDGNGGEPATAGEAASVDQSVLDNALLNESEFAANGYELEGRAWLARDVGLSFYVNQDGNHLFSLLMRGGADVDSTQYKPEDGEGFADFVARKSPGGERSVEVGSTAKNVLLFDPANSPAAATVRPQTVGRNDYCPRSWFDAQCSDWTGFNSPQFPLTWYLTDRTTPVSEAQDNITGWVATACADVGTLDFSVQDSNFRWTPGPGSFAITLNQGNATKAWNASTWTEEHYCKTHVLGVCVDYAYRIKFLTFTANASISPRAGAEGHFCGTMTSNADYYQGDLNCETRLTCPGLCAPGATDGQCTYRGPVVTGN